MVNVNLSALSIGKASIPTGEMGSKSETASCRYTEVRKNCFSMLSNTADYLQKRASKIGASVNSCSLTREEVLPIFAMIILASATFCLGYYNKSINLNFRCFC
jgi:hypothetical protein